MSKVVVTHSYFLRFDGKQWKGGRPYPPLGTLYAAAMLQQQGYQVSFVDTMFYSDPAQIKAALEQRPSTFIIYDDGFNYLTKMCLTNMQQAAFTMIGLAKEKGAKVIVCSSDATDHYKKYLQAGADFVLLGEGENTLMELMNALENGVTHFENIKGIAYRKNEEIIRPDPRPVMKDLDALPMPAWDLLDIDSYKKMWLKNAGYFSINIGTTRGCPFKCNWCAKPIYGNRYHARSAENVVEELKFLQQRTGFDHVWFCDDIFGLKPGWVCQFADLVEKEKIKFQFKIQSRADLLVQENYVAALARAGCTEVWMGAESGSQKILDAMDKGINIEQIKQATFLLRKHHIKPCFFIQFGYLGETKEDIDLTIKMINELMPHEIGISVSYPLPGTGFYEKVKEQLKEKTNWTDSDEMALMFHNTFSPSYYKQLHQFVHKNYRKHLALKNFRSLVQDPKRFIVSSLRKVLSGLYLAPAVFLSARKLRKLEKAL